jgi:ubiquinol-cytochrome c reductase cytochrome b subunit
VRLSEWFDERLGTHEIRRALFDRHIPRSGPATEWLYTLGSVLLFYFVLQAVTGMMLAMNYTPSPDHAFDAVRFISVGTPMGQFIRGLHSWGASAMVIVVGLHMLTTYLTGAYKYPREVTWITGVALLLVVMLFGFTGYLLPWNQKSYWATVVGTNIAGAAPVVGGYIKEFLRGGDEVGPQTLTRFYAFHVLMLPAAIIVFIAVHLFLVVRQGITAPPQRHPVDTDAEVAQQREAAKETYLAKKEAGESFYPFYLAKDAVAVVLALIVVVVLAWKFPVEIGELADPASTTYNPRPDWYFLFLFQALKYFPGNLESIAAVVLPTLALIILALLPFFDRRMTTHPFDRPFATIASLAVVGGILFLTVAGARSPLVSPYVPEVPTVAEGHRLYHSLHCEYCHSVNGRGAHIGPDLALDPLKHDTAWITSHIQQPAAVVKPGAPVVSVGLLAGETSDIVDYIEELQGGGPYSPQAPKLFFRNCGKCHRVDGHGGTKGPDLTSIGLTRTRSFIHRYTEDPKSIYGDSNMPGFLKPEGKLSHEQIEDISRYLAHQRGPATAANNHKP